MPEILTPYCRLHINIAELKTNHINYDKQMIIHIIKIIQIKNKIIRIIKGKERKGRKVKKFKYI